MSVSVATEARKRTLSSAQETDTTQVIEETNSETSTEKQSEVKSPETKEVEEVQESESESEEVDASYLPTIIKDRTVVSERKLRTLVLYLLEHSEDCEDLLLNLLPPPANDEHCDRCGKDFDPKLNTKTSCVLFGKDHDDTGSYDRGECPCGAWDNGECFNCAKCGEGFCGYDMSGFAEHLCYSGTHHASPKDK